MLMGPDGKPLAPPTVTPPGTLRVAREELGSLQVGQIVAYHIIGPSRFTIAASRVGVELIGQTPPLGAGGMPTVLRLIRRQLRQHEALAAVPVGEKQTPLTEAELDLMEMPAHFGGGGGTGRPASDVTHGGNGLPHDKGV